MGATESIDSGDIGRNFSDMNVMRAATAGHAATPSGAMTCCVLAGVGWNRRIQLLRLSLAAIYKRADFSFKTDSFDPTHRRLSIDGPPASMDHVPRPRRGTAHCRFPRR
ncbi:MAG: hypothetical protein KDJ24_09145 [Gammaproteobacteria bacterium]|nr:hypothetical protein [Gammaproteobacteria bacterium]